MRTLESSLRALRDTGRKALVPYFMAGLSPDWLRHVEAAAHAGADAIEIGLPFSDPMMDGVVIQEAGRRALERGTTFDNVAAELAAVEVGVPLIAMTYYNVILHGGLERSASRLSDARISGAIIPDLPLEELDPWEEVAAQFDLATVLLVAPSTPAPRVGVIAARTSGFCYAQGRMAVTGVSSDDGEGGGVALTVRRASDVPVYIGVGIATPEQARNAASASDGVIVGSALVRLLLDGASASEIERFVATFRGALDQ
ncbi:MAG TPA: tryptophan synthase subunit alpha [Acidimicrobiales bacterium]|nr:tryptophan synthase subunit alpha [Acidimicrobiales bacterium]